MDIKHLLCHPCEPYSFLNKTAKETNMMMLDIAPSPLLSYHQNSNNMFHYEEVEFWRHSRSNSTQSISSCSSSGQSSVISNFNHHPSPSSPIMKSPNYRQLVTSEICRRSISANNGEDNSASNSSKFIISSPQQQQQKNRRSRSNSASYIQTRTPWTPEEDELLQKGYEQGLSWAMISCTYLPHRSRGCCWGRFKTLQSKNVIEVYQQRICQRPWKITSSKGEKKK